MNTSASQPVVRRVPARVGLVGNPSDGFGGAVLATIVPGLDALVSVSESDTIAIAGPDTTEQWPSLAAWQDEVERDGAHGPQRIICAALWTLVAHLRRTEPGAIRCGIALSWRTDIPRSVGLAGSSALAVGTIDAVSACWGVTLDRRVCAALALSAERDMLGIAAGWQDRIVQAFGRTVLVDAASMEVIDGVAVPGVLATAASADDARPIRLVVGWHADSASPSDTYHAPLRRDPLSLASPMGGLATLARSARSSLEHGDVHALCVAVDDGWRLRQSCVPLHPGHGAIVESVRAAGVSATTPGSGGSVVAVCTDDEAVHRVRGVLSAAGCGAVDFTIR